MKSARAIANLVVAGAAAAVCIGFVACSASPKRQSAGPPESMSADYDLSRKEEIRRAWQRIGELREDPKLGLPREPASPFSTATPLTTLRQCVEGPKEPVVPGGCSDVCSIKDAICDNAEDICRIASELGGDAWADDKCDSAKASCKEAKEICCGCIDE